jgi:hypothetical protein
MTPTPELREDVRRLLEDIFDATPSCANSVADEILGILGGWQPIETAPLNGTPLLLYVPGVNSWNRRAGMPDIVVGLWEGDQGGGVWLSDIGDVDQGYESTGAYFEHEVLRPTHWMPLPAAPTAQTPPQE